MHGTKNEKGGKKGMIPSTCSSIGSMGKVSNIKPKALGTAKGTKTEKGRG